MRFPHGSGFGIFGGIIEDVIAGLFFLVCFVVVVGLLFVLVRFLLVATKAAEIYVAKNGSVAQASPAQPVGPAAATTSATPAATRATTTMSVTKPTAAPRIRPTKTPPTT